MCLEKFKLFPIDRMHVLSTYSLIMKVTELFNDNYGHIYLSVALQSFCWTLAALSLS
jgi:hypothetical protein